jgi:hypothetical protein
MVDITFRTAGAWGAGKGTVLTKEEVDGNFFSLKQAVEDLVGSPTEPLQIDDITVSDNQMTITLSDLTTTFGPFTLPVATFAWKDAFAGGATYEAWDVFTAIEGMYLVLQDHTADATFDPARTSVSGPIYRLIFPFPNIYDFGFFYPGQPGRGLDVGGAMFAHAFARDVVLFAGLAGSVAKLKAAPADDLSFHILNGDTVVGSIDFAAYSTVGTFTFPADVGFLADDWIRVTRPDVLDDAASELAVTFVGKLGELS